MIRRVYLSHWIDEMSSDEMFTGLLWNIELTGWANGEPFNVAPPCGTLLLISERTPILSLPA